MKTNNTITYPQVQAIEPTVKSKKSNVLTGAVFGLFLGGLALNYFGMSNGFGHVPGVMVIGVAVVLFIVAQKLSPVCKFPKNNSESFPDPDKIGPLGWSVSSPFRPSYYGSISRD